MDEYIGGLSGNSGRLKGIDEDEEESTATKTTIPVVMVSAPPETPTESMEFLARSWSLSAQELSKALTHSRLHSNVLPSNPFSPLGHNDDCVKSLTADISNEAVEATTESSPQLLIQVPPQPCQPPQPDVCNFPNPTMEDEAANEVFLLQQALNPEFLAYQQGIKNGLYKNVLRGRTMGRWIKDQKERRKQEIRTHKAQLHAAISVAGVAAAIAAIAATTASSATQRSEPYKTSGAVASAAALVASHCVEIAQEMGAERDQILNFVNSAVNVKTNGDIMTITAGAATALRGAATLKARLEKGFCTAALALNSDMIQDKELGTSALTFVTRGGELLKRTRKGALHWKQVTISINSQFQVVAKLKSKHMGAFTKKKKCVVSDVHCDILPWMQRESEEESEGKAYFGIKTADRLIEFECRSKFEKQMWTDGIRQMLHRHGNMV